MTVTVERRTYSCGGEWCTQKDDGKLLRWRDGKHSNESLTAVFRAKGRHSVYLVIANGWRVDSFLKKRNADRLAAQLRRAEG